MATPSLSKFQLPGAVGEILIDVRAADRASPAPAVLVLHGFKGFKDWGMFPPFAERLARSGFVTVSFNVSGSGVDDEGRFAWPERFGHNTFTAEQADIAAVLDALDTGALGTPRPTSVGIVGHSRGGGMAVLAAHRHPRFGALVTWSAVATVERWSAAQRKEWREKGRLDVVNSRTGQVLPMYTDVLDDVEAHAGDLLDIPAAAAALHLPWLIVHGEEDESVPFSEAELLAREAGPHARLLPIPGAGHTFGAVHPFAGTTPGLEQVFDATATFLGTNLT